MSDPQTQVPEWAWIAACRLAGIDPLAQRERVLIIAACGAAPVHTVVVAVKAEPDRVGDESLHAELGKMHCPLCGWYGLRQVEPRPTLSANGKVEIVAMCLSSPGHQVLVPVDKSSAYSLESALAQMKCPLCEWYGLRVAR